MFKDSNFATKYRPTTFSEVLGQDVAKSLLKNISKAPGISVRSIFIKGAWGSGKCVPSGTHILTSFGYQSIESIFPNPKEGFNSFKTNILTRQGTKPTSHFYYEKNADVLTFTLSNGYQIKGTAKHRVLCHHNGEVLLLPLGEVTPSTTFLLYSKPISFGVDDSRANLLGLLLRDGGISNGTHYFCGTYDLCQKVKKLANWSGEIVKDKRNCKLYTVKSHINDILSIKFPSHFNSSNKELPSWAFNLSIKSRIELIKGLSKTEGSFSKDFELTSKSKKLINQIYEIFLTLGCVGSIITKYVDNVPFYRLRVSKAKLCNLNTSKYGNHLEFSNPINLKELVNLHSSELNYINSITFPKKGHQRWLSVCKRNYNFYKRATKRTLIKFYRHTGHLPASLFQALDYTEVSWSSVQSSKEDVYDVSVPEIHEFYAQGTFNHNTTLSRIFAKSMNCSNFHKLGDVCNNCPGCNEVSNPNSTLYYELDASVVGNVDSIKSFINTFSFRPNGRRVVVIDECHSASRQALNTLLKVLEEGIPDTIFVFASTEEILPTIQSRSVCVDISELPHNLIISKLKDITLQEGISIDPETLNIISIKSAGHMRDAISLLQLYSLAGKEAIESSYSTVIKFILSVLSSKPISQINQYLQELLKYPILDIKSSIYLFIENILSSQNGDKLYKLNSSGIGIKLFKFFFDPIHQQALKDEVGTSILLRSFSTSFKV